MITNELLKEVFARTVSDIFAYGSDYLETGIRIGIITAIIYSILALLWIIIRKKPQKGRSIALEAGKIPFILLLIIYMYSIIGITILSRNFGRERMVDLQIFSTFSMKPTDLVFIVENIILFIPLGFLLPFIWKCMRHFYICIPAGLLCSMAVEAAQYLFRCGKTQIDDVFNNLLGTIIGFLIYCTVHKCLGLFHSRMRDA